MAQRWSAVLWPSVVFAALGFLIGVGDWQLAASFALSRFTEWGDLPMPRSMQWISGLRPGLHWIAVSRFGIPLSLLILGGLGIWLFARTLNPEFGLLVAREENPGEGTQAHVDVPRTVRAAVAAVLTLWLLMVFVRAASLWDYTSQWRPAYRVFGSLPIWLDPLPVSVRPIVHGLVLGAALWLLWGPNGFVGRRGGPIYRDLLWGLAAGLAATPALLALYHARTLAQAWRQIIGLSDAGGWRLLLLWLLLVPLLACLWLWLVTYFCRPRPVTHRFASRFGPLALVSVMTAFAGGARLQAETAHTDYLGKTLSQTLQLPPARGRRKALVLAPNGTALLSAPEDGSNDNNGDRIICTPESVERVETFLRQRHFMTAHAFRAYVHLYDCAALEWNSDRELSYSLQMLETAPTPVAAQILKEQLSECAVTPESRRVLDRLADARRFTWPQPLGQRWLGVAYLRFGDLDRARSYLLHASLGSSQFRGLLGGINPLADGTVSGRVLINGRTAPLRVGLAPAGSSLGIPGPCRPFEWRHVTVSTETAPDGRFSLRGVAEGRYVLLLSGAGIQEHRALPKVSRVGMILVDRFHPTVELGNVELHYNEPVPISPDQGATQTAASPRAPASGAGATARAGTGTARRVPAA